jgi:hypothetical protein
MAAWASVLSLELWFTRVASKLEFVTPARNSGNVTSLTDPGEGCRKPPPAPSTPQDHGRADLLTGESPLTPALALRGPNVQRKMPAQSNFVINFVTGRTIYDPVIP